MLLSQHLHSCKYLPDGCESEVLWRRRMAQPVPPPRIRHDNTMVGRGKLYSSLDEMEQTEYGYYFDTNLRRPKLDFRVTGQSGHWTVPEEQSEQESTKQAIL